MKKLEFYKKANASIFNLLIISFLILVGSIAYSFFNLLLGNKMNFDCIPEYITICAVLIFLGISFVNK